MSAELARSTIAMASRVLLFSGLVLTDGLVLTPAARLSARVRAPLMVAEAPLITRETAKVSFDTSIDEIPKCPITRWDADNIDLSSVTAPARTLPHKVPASVAAGDEEAYFVANREAILTQLTESGAIWFQGFKLMSTTEGFQRFYELLQLSPCQDPLASVGARAVVSKKGAMYEAVNKPSRSKFFVGMHNESTFKRTNRLGAFVCFKQADKGGEFLLLDGRKMLKAIPADTLQRVYERGVRFSNAELPFFDFLRSAGPLRPVLQPVIEAVAKVAVGAKIDMELDLRWDENETDGLRLLAFSPPQPAINRHPVTGEPAWFCNVHSHSRYLRDKRDGVLPESTGASKLNRTNMFFGDLSEISNEDLDAINQVGIPRPLPPASCPVASGRGGPSEKCSDS
jgi:hypothetical protein